MITHITFLDTVLGTIDFFCDSGGLDAFSCLLRTTISVSPFSSLPGSPWRVFCGLLAGGWRRKVNQITNKNVLKKKRSKEGIIEPSCGSSIVYIEWRLVHTRTQSQ